MRREIVSGEQAHLDQKINKNERGKNSLSFSVFGFRLLFRLLENDFSPLGRELTAEIYIVYYIDFKYCTNIYVQNVYSMQRRTCRIFE